MGDIRHHLRSFGAGEVTPEFFGMIADPKFQTGAARVRNYVVKPHGPIENRAGTEFVREVYDSTKLTRTLPFVYGFGQSLIIEFAEDVFRFHALGETILFPVAPAWVTATVYTQGDLVLQAGTTYYAKEAHTSGVFATDLAAGKWYAEPASGVFEVPHTYLEAELFEVTYAQSGDVVQLRHRNHPRRELQRLGATEWALVELEVGPGIDPPTGESGVATPGGTPGAPFDTDYVVTAITTTGDESLQSGVVTVSNNLYDDGAYNTIDWDAHADATVVRYNIYKKAAGLFGYIGQTDQLNFQDDNIAPDLGATPPLDIDLFTSADNYPGAVAYQDQRKAEAGTIDQPQNVWMTRAGSEDNFNFSIPAKDDDSIQFKIASRENNAIYHLVPMADLIACTPAALWRISGGLSEVLTPLTLTAKEQTFVGSSQTKPLKVGNNMLYIAARGGHLREFGFDGDRNGYISGDISIRAPHLFDTDGVRSMTAQYDPFPTIWACMTSGKMTGLTYIPEQQIAAFHWHDTGPLDAAGVARDLFEDATTIYEDGRDVTYVVVRRTIDGATVRYIERFADRRFTEDEDQFFVDCGYRYEGVAPVTQLTGLDWLEGEEVAILADGAVLPVQTITAGVLTLPDEIEATKINVGLPYVCQLQTLPMALELQGYGQGMPKNVNEVVLRVYRSSAVFAGPSFDEDELVEAKVRTLENLGSPPDLITGVMEIVTKGAWTDDGQVCIQHTDPRAQTILSMTIDAAIGGG
jgi:hypothetical protein